jgi:hypothetical protein
MFVIKPNNTKEWQHAMFILSYYSELKINTYSDGEDERSAYMVVESHYTGDSQESLRLAEMCFQMNWHQGRNLCPHCTKQDADGTSEDGVSDDVCGHLTFVRKIKPAF